MCHRFDFVEGAGQLFFRWLNPVFLVRVHTGDSQITGPH